MNQQGFRNIAAHTAVAYVRMAATVVVAVVVRVSLDCIGLIVTRQEPMQMGFWFAHCGKDGQCVLTAGVIFLTTLVGCSIFAWGTSDWIMDPRKNPCARRYSFGIIVEAATWIPISVVVGKTNVVVEWFMDIAQDDLVQALVSSAVAAALTVLCALLTHVAMTYCSGVMRSATVKESGLPGFFKFLILATLYCLGWAAAWSNWALVLAIMDAVEPGKSMHNAVLSAAVLLVFLIFCICIYLKYGPEPIIPDPDLQQICYNQGYSSSVRRSLLSYIVYSCVVFIVMCICDPNYGLVITLAKDLYTSTSNFALVDVGALAVLAVLACLVTCASVLCSAALNWYMEVDEFSSMKLSRSLHDRCQEMVTVRRSSFDRALLKVIEDGSDAHLAEFQRASIPGEVQVSPWLSSSSSSSYRVPSQAPWLAVEGSGSFRREPLEADLESSLEGESQAIPSSSRQPPALGGFLEVEPIDGNALLTRATSPSKSSSSSSTSAYSPPHQALKTISSAWHSLRQSSSKSFSHIFEEETRSGSKSESDPRSRYMDMDSIYDHEDIASERELFLNSRTINSSLCIGVLVYDVLGFVVCFQWGALALRFYSVLFGQVADIHPALYVASCLLYASVVTAAVSRFVFKFFPSAEERACSPKSLDPTMDDDPRAVALVSAEDMSSPRISVFTDGNAKKSFWSWMQFPFSRHSRCDHSPVRCELT